MNQELTKKIRELRKTLREDYERIVNNFQKIFLEMDSYLEYVENSMKGGV